MGHIIHWATQTLNYLLRSNKRAGRPAKLDGHVWRALICHIERSPYNNLALLGTSSKSGIKLSWNAIRGYLKTASFIEYKAQKTLFDIII